MHTSVYCMIFLTPSHAYILNILWLQQVCHLSFYFNLLALNNVILHFVDNLYVHIYIYVNYGQ